MLRRTSYVWRTLFAVVDLGLSAGVFLVSYELRFQPPTTWFFPSQHSPPPLESYAGVLPLLVTLLAITNSYFRLYHPRRVSSFLEEFGALVKSNALAALILMTLFFMERSVSYGRGIVLLFVFLNPMAVFLLRVFVRGSLRVLRARGYNLRHVLIAGTGRTAQTLLHAFRRNRWTGVVVVGLISLRDETVGRKIGGTPVVASCEGLGTILDERQIDQVYVALPPTNREAVQHILGICADRLVATRVAETRPPEVRGPVTTDFDGLQITSVWESHLTGGNAFAKRALDVVVSSLAIVVLAPLLAVVALAIAASSRGPVFYSQERMGLDGRVFSMIKFRTMKTGAETRNHFTTPDDDRCTRLGRWLRRSSLDELPQLVNVLLGQMSLVGPRPERPVFIRDFRRSLPGYMLRHRIKAGMTGWAQVHGWRGDSSLRKRLQYDLFYMHNWSIGFDLKILLITLVKGWRHPNAY